MNYKKETLESKIFNFSKHLLCNTLLTICIVFVGALLIVHFSNCAIYDVLSNSQSPEISEGDLIVIKGCREYEVGDIITFQKYGIPFTITHRILAIKECGNRKYYICHGDNETSVMSYFAQDKNLSYYSSWEMDSAFLKTLDLRSITQAEEILQVVEVSEIKGKVLFKVYKAGKIIRVLKSKGLLIAVLWSCLLIVDNFKIKKIFK